MSDSFVDLVGEGIDLAVRVGEIADPDPDRPAHRHHAPRHCRLSRTISSGGESPSIPPI